MAFKPLADRPQEPSAMDDGCNRAGVVSDTVDQSVAAYEALSDGLLCQLWHHAPQERKLAQLARRLEDFLDHRPRLRCGISRDVAGNGFHICHGLGRPNYLIVHGRKRCFTSAWVSVPCVSATSRPRWIFPARTDDTGCPPRCSHLVTSLTRTRRRFSQHSYPTP